MNENSDILRIIASQSSLSATDREEIRTAADELEAAQRTISVIYAEMIEAQQKHIAVNDQLIALRRVQSSEWSVSSGWCPVTGYKI